VWRGLCSPHFDKRLGTGGAGVENRKQETDKTVPIIMEVFTSTTNCTFTAKIVEGQDPNFFQALRFGSVCPTFKFVPVPLHGSPSPFVIL